MSPTLAAVGLGALLAASAAQPAGPRRPRMCWSPLPRCSWRRSCRRQQKSSCALVYQPRTCPRRSALDSTSWMRTLFAGAKDEQAARQAIASALSLDSAAMLPDVAPAQLREILEDARALLPARSRPPAPVPPRQPPAKSLVTAVDELYRGLQLEGAVLVLQLAIRFRSSASMSSQALVFLMGVV